MTGATANGPTGAGATGTGLLHDALFYGADDELVAAAAPFLRAGMEAGDRTLLVCTEHNTALLTEALDGDPRLRTVPAGDTYRRVPGTIDAYRHLMLREVAGGTRRVRLVGEVNFGDSPGEWEEWTRYEAVCNRALAPYPLWAICLYDTRQLPAQVLTAGLQTHPHLVGVASRRSNPHYIDPADFLRRSARRSPDPAEAGPPVLVVDDLTDLGQLRHDLRAILTGPDLPAESADGFVLAVSEVAANAVRHGRPPVAVRLWAGPTRWLCTVTDHGAGIDDPFTGYTPAVPRGLSPAGLGLWLTRQLCDRVSLTTTRTGFTVRLELRR